MRWPQLLKGLLQLIVASFIWALGVAGILDGNKTLLVYGLSIVTFSIFTIGIFLWARAIVDRDQLYTFNSVISVSFIVKLVMAIGSIWLYEHYMSPADNLHLLHYIITYLAFTAYEVYFLTELGKEG